MITYKEYRKIGHTRFTSFMLAADCWTYVVAIAVGFIVGWVLGGLA